MLTEAFRGQVYQKVDSKARVSIPAAFRRILDAEDPPSAEFPRTRMVMVFGGRGRKFVECYSKAGADALARSIDLIPEGTRDRLLAEMELIAQSIVVEIDDDGRIVMPPDVREKLKIGADDLAAGAEAAFVGATNRFKLYRRSDYTAVLTELLAAQGDDNGEDILATVSRYKTGT